MAGISTTLIHTLQGLQGSEKEYEMNQINVGANERWISMLGGAALILAGVSRRSLAGLSLAVGGGYLVYRGLTGHCPVYEAMGVNMAAPGLGPGIHIKKSLTINKSAAEIYQFWRNFENLPRFMDHLERVQVTGDNQSHWVARGPMGITLEWDAQLLEDRENELISWRSLPGADVDNWGTVQFQEVPGGRGTEVQVRLEYNPPGGVPGVAFAKLFNRVAAQQIKEDVRRLKEFLEAGEIATTKGQPHGPRRGEDSTEFVSYEAEMFPGPEVNDVVEVASWESFPASDPPAWRSRRSKHEYQARNYR